MMLKEETRVAGAHLRVEVLRLIYIRERDARRPSTTQWNEYARALHEYRLMKRELLK
jgi:hypothetical protein